MPTIFCQSCGAKNVYDSKRPESCAKCKTKFVKINASPVIESKAAPTKKASPVKDKAFERKMDLLKKRRRKDFEPEDVEDEDLDDEEDDDEDDDEEDSSIPRPKKLKAHVEAHRCTSIDSLGGFLKSVNPKWKDSE